MVAPNLFDGPDVAPAASPPLPRRPVVLRPYQEESIARTLAAFDRGMQRGLVVMATGCGKTTVFSELIRRADVPTLVIAHQDELLEQAAARIRSMCPGRTVAVEGGDKRAPMWANVVVASVQSIGRESTSRLSWFKPKLVVVDECHHAAADSYMTVFRRHGCFESGGAKLIGVTATPHRLDNKPLHGTEKAIFEEVLYDMGISRAIREGWLCDLRAYRVAAAVDLSGVKKTAGDFNLKQLEERMNNDADNELAFNSWRDVAADRRSLVFCCGIDHAEEVAEMFRAHGVAAEAIHGRMPKEQRDAAMSRFRSGRTQVLTNMQLVTEGVDVPEASAVVLLRPTQSWSLFTQMVGRGVRTAPGCIDGLPDDAQVRREAIAESSKPDCIVIDVVGITAGQSLASVPGILGLPPQYDMGGGSAVAAMDEWDDLDGESQAALFRRPTTFRGLTAELKKVDLLEELKPTEEVAKASPYAWLKLCDCDYSLSCGSIAGEEKREARLTADTLGNWRLTLRSSQRNEALDLGSLDVESAFRAADGAVRRSFPGVGAIAATAARWRQDRPTEKQIALLRRKGVALGDIERMNKGQASQMLDKLIKGKKVTD